MKMNLNEMEALYAFGCPNRKATIERLRLVAAIAPDPAAKKLFYMLSVKLSAEGADGIAASTTICVYEWMNTTTTRRLWSVC